MLWLLLSIYSYLILYLFQMKIHALSLEFPRLFLDFLFAANISQKIKLN